MAHTLTVGQLAHATGVPAKTIRYYEQTGVLSAPRRSATGYRQYDQRAVHRLLFIRRARALGLSLPSIKALTAALDSGQCLSMRPQLKHLVTEQLRTVREQIVEFQLLEQQLAQMLHRLLTAPASNHAEGCQCLELDAPAVQETAQQSPPLTHGGEDMSASTTLESLTRLATTTKGSCGCGCGCDDEFVSVAVMLPSATTAQPDTLAADAFSDREARV
jgi:DNA-binding transcriptional MerR regulator